MGLVPARRPGWLLEGRGNPSPRGMVAQSRLRVRRTEPGLQALWQIRRFARSPSGERHPKPQEVMARQKRTDDWGFPRWRSYGDKGRQAARIRLCDREGCTDVGDRPAPKAPNKPERWYFCESHAAEYNRNWNYFAGLSPEDAARRAAEEEREGKGFRQSAQWKWAGPGDGSRSRDEMRALGALELDSDADFKAIKAAHRRLVKETHPDANPGDAETAKRFKQVQAAYDVLKRAEERKNGKAA